MKKLIAVIVRHGESVGNDMGIFRSQRDYALTNNGVEQAEKARDFLKRFKVTIVLASPLQRATVTATIIAENWGLYVFQQRSLFPFSTGVFTGLKKDEHKDALELFIENPSIVIPQGESLDQFEERQFDFWNTFLKKDSKGLPLVVCHNSVITSLVKFASNEDTDLAHKEIIKPGGILGVYRDGAKYSVEVLFGKAESAAVSGS